jgi:hypothetical protein
MISSLQRVDDKASIYVLCMDELCEKIMNDLRIGVCILISLTDFMDDELARIKKERKRAEFCWTCTSKLIKYVLCKFHQSECTYIDSDLFFYTNPNVLINEMKTNGRSVQVISHRFLNNTKGKLQEMESGKNCVQFNTFTSENNSINLLDQWINQCMNECSVGGMGDQKYTDNWGDLPYVNVSHNGGAGIAPWNLNRYRQCNNDAKKVYDRYDRKIYDLIFYHFQYIIYLDRLKVKLTPYANYWRIDKRLFNSLYVPYLVEIERIKRFLEKNYSFVPLIKSNVFVSKQGMKNIYAIIRALKGKSFSEVVCKINDFLRRIIRKKRLIIDISRFL